MATADLTAARLREVLRYDPATGVFLWQIAPNAATVGTVAGQITEAGYRRIEVDGVRHRAHRLAWLYVHGRWPVSQLDHRNGRRDDNRIDNLRDVTNAVNNQNLKAAKSNNRSGFLGVYWHGKNKWVSRITVAGKKITLGTGFETPEEAHALYLSAKRRLHEGCTI